MASIRILRRRIKSAKNIAQITKAMELVAASKMKKAQAQALAGKQYAQKIYEMVTELARRTDVSNHPYLIRPKTITGKRLLVLISTTKGLCGGLNSNLFRYCLKTYPDFHKQDVITIGKKGSGLVVRLGATLAADFSETTPFITAVPAIVELIVFEFLAGHYDGVDVIFNEFKSALQQVPKKKIMLPLTIEAGPDVTDKKSDFSEFLIEPSKREVFDALLPHYLENQVRDAILQAEASEHSARMVAMRNATDNALSLIDGLTLMYNKERQAKITYEIADIVTARLAVE
ncbi:MAG: ATP synthase F1 subunit gamma [Candidatus Gottesmanbacteria bacterium]